jgi:hypothetical protein
LDLTWSLTGTTPKNIPKDAFFYLDVVSLAFEPDRPPRLLPSCEPLPLSLTQAEPKVFGYPALKAKYTLSIFVAAENAKPLTRAIEFTFDPREKELAVKFDG